MIHKCDIPSHRRTREHLKRKKFCFRNPLIKHNSLNYHFDCLGEGSGFCLSPSSSWFSKDKWNGVDSVVYDVPVGDCRHPPAHFNEKWTDSLYGDISRRRRSYN